MKPCEWCGHEHDVTALCTKRPKWSRRGFLALAGAAVVGAVLPSLPTVPAWEGIRISQDFARAVRNIDAMQAQLWHRVTDAMVYRLDKDFAVKP